MNQLNYSYISLAGLKMPLIRWLAKCKKLGRAKTKILEVFKSKNDILNLWYGRSPNSNIISPPYLNEISID